MSEHDDLDTIRCFFNEGGTLQALMNIDSKDLDYVYSYSCQLFKMGDYVNSKRFLLVLIRLSHWQYDYWLSLGLCCQMLSEHEEAIFCFGQAGLLRLDDPSPVFFTGLCLNHLKKINEANKAYGCALKICANNEKYKDLKIVINQKLSVPIERKNE